MSSRERISLEKVKVEIGECLVIYWRPDGILSRDLPFELEYNGLFLIELKLIFVNLDRKTSIYKTNLFYLSLKLIMFILEVVHIRSARFIKLLN